MSCLSIAGPYSRRVLTKLTTENMEGKSFPFLSTRLMDVAGIPVRALRITYTGELGWELYHPAEHTLSLYNSLLDAGEEFGIGDFGTYALNVLRLEKGFRMWGAEMNMDSNPYEAGLDYFVCIDKPVDFIGKYALQRVLGVGISRKLAFLKVHSDGVDPEGNESVWCSDKIVGFTTSGAFGCTVNHGIAFAYLPPFLTVPGTKVQVQLLGDLVQAEVLAAPPMEIESVRRKKKQESF